jgi:hypothetical protein
MVQNDANSYIYMYKLPHWTAAKIKFQYAKQPKTNEMMMAIKIRV